MRRLNIDEKESLKAWQGYLLALIEESSVDTTEPIEVQKARIAQLEADPEAWFKYYFPSFATCEPAPFHKQATKRLLEHERWYEVRSWSRDLAKSTRSMMEVIYLALMGTSSSSPIAKTKPSTYSPHSSSSWSSRHALPTTMVCR